MESKNLSHLLKNICFLNICRFTKYSKMKILRNMIYLRLVQIRIGLRISKEKKYHSAVDGLDAHGNIDKTTTDLWARRNPTISG
jgi:hypothetical protein